MDRLPTEMPTIRAALENSLQFRALAPEQLDHIAALGRIVRLRDNQRVPNHQRRDCWIVISGCLRVSSVTAQGRELVMALLGPGNFYGLGNALSSAPNPLEARAAGGTTLATIPGRSLLDLLEREPALWRPIAALLHERALLAVLLARDLSLAPLAQRIARRLVWQAMYAGEAAASSERLALRISQSDLGRMTGAARSQVNAALRRMERDGMVEIGYRSLRLTDMAGLRSLAGPDLPAF